VVIKEPHAKGSAEEIAIDRLHFESDVLRYLNDEKKLGSAETNQLISSHVVRYVDRAADERRPLLILEFVEGPSLSTAFKQPIPEKTCLIHISVLLNVVMALHDKGIVHRDISAGNVLFNSDRGMVLIDFGTSLLSRKIAGLSNPDRGEVIFKRGFSSPELLRGHSDERSDVFSVGAIMFLLLTGRNPGDFMSNSQVLEKAACEVNPSVSRQASGIIQAAMSPDPRTRFLSPAQMLEATEELRKPISVSGARIVFGHTHYPVAPTYTEIGRQHVCDKSCTSHGFSSPPHVLLADPRKYIEKHHARIWVLSGDRYLIEDLKSVNGTAVKSGNGQFRVLPSFEKVSLKDKDIVALAFSANRGPYVTFEFNR
jgi:serine/threonine protein kinase